MEQLLPVANSAVDDFMRYYEGDGYLSYESLSDRAQWILMEELDNHCIKHETYARGKEGSAGGKAKSPASVRLSAIRRQTDRGQDYKEREEILSDMHDLAGLRVALYYPNDFREVENIIKERFVEVKPPQDWPDQQYGPFRYPSLDGGPAGRTDISGRRSRFPGYFARHYRVKLKDSDVTEPAIKGKTLEIQLMSLLMHAWAKMHHELIYKPRAGLPQADENDERLLDISSGIIIAGEQVLRQIQINLDTKKEFSRLPFQNEHAAWSYLKDKHIAGGNEMISKPLKLGLMPANPAREENFRHLLYKSLEMVQFNTREKLDLLVEYCFESRTTDSELLNRLSLVEILIISIVEQDAFKVIEAEQLQLPDTETRNLGISEAAKLTRYNALIVCNSLKWYGYSSPLREVWEGRGDFTGSYPSGEAFLRVLHPLSAVESGCKPGSMAHVRDVCEYLLKWDDLTWVLCCALSRLTCFRISNEYNTIKTDEGPSHQWIMTTCPWGLIRLLDHCGANPGTPLQEAFKLLEASERFGMSNLYEHPNQMLPLSYRDYLNPRVAYRPRYRGDGRDDDWTVEKFDDLGPGVCLGFTEVRKYLDHQVSMAHD